MCLNQRCWTILAAEFQVSETCELKMAYLAWLLLLIIVEVIFGICGSGHKHQEVKKNYKHIILACISQYKFHWLQLLQFLTEAALDD